MVMVNEAMLAVILSAYIEDAEIASLPPLSPAEQHFVPPKRHCEVPSVVLNRSAVCADSTFSDVPTPMKYT